jgi:predicted aldo/keto reductase-like oxidoreductase
MEYRQLGKTRLKVSVIGIGAEHLKNLPAEEIRQIIDLALNEEITYFDLVWSLPNITEGFQQSLQTQNAKAHIAFHLGSCISNGKYKRSRDPAECEKYLRTLLNQLNMDSAPILNIHYVPNLNAWTEINKKGILALAQKLKEQQIADIISISTHDPEVIKLAAESGIIENVMHQVNIANHAYTARDEALRTCSALSIGVVAMKPFAGGELLKAGQKVRFPLTNPDGKQ